MKRMGQIHRFTCRAASIRKGDHAGRLSLLQIHSFLPPPFALRFIQLQLLAWQLSPSNPVQDKTLLH
jgi:hypothetical protein